MAAKRAKLRATILLLLETREIASGNTAISSPDFVTKTLSRLTQLIIVVTQSVSQLISQAVSQ